MKSSLVGLVSVSVAILVVVAGVGFGIAQAEGTHSARPILTFEDQETLETVTVYCHYEENNPVLSFKDQENLVRDSEHVVFDENRPVLSFEDEEVIHVAMLAYTNEICGSR